MLINDQTQDQSGIRIVGLYEKVVSLIETGMTFNEAVKSAVTYINNNH